jgi:predicted DNA-binding transcriptional regulator
MARPMRAAIPKEEEIFLRTYIRSVEQLEVLLLLVARARWMAIKEVSDHLYSSEGSIALRLKALCDQGLLEVQVDVGKLVYRFAPRNPALRPCVESLAGTYKTRRLRVIEILYPRTSPGIREFSNAFRMRKDEPTEHG